MRFIISVFVIGIIFVFISEFIFKKNNMHSLKISYYLYYIFSVFCGIFYYNYLPLAPDSIMFSNMITTGAFPIAQTGTLEVVSFYWITRPVSILIDGDMNAYIFFYKSLLSLSLILLFIFFVDTFKFKGNFLAKYQYLLIFLSIYPSFNVVYNNIFREVYELFIISLVLFLFVNKKYVWALIFSVCLFFIRYSDIIIVASLIISLFFSRYVKKSVDTSIVVLFLIFGLLLILWTNPNIIEHFVNRRIDHNDFVLGFNASNCHHYFATGTGYSSLDMFDFVSKSFIQYILDPINIAQCSDGSSTFMWIESVFSVGLLSLVTIFCLIRKKISLYLVGLAFVLLLQSLYEYYVQAGMRHRVFVYIFFIYHLVFCTKSTFNVRFRR